MSEKEGRYIKLNDTRRNHYEKVFYPLLPFFRTSAAERLRRARDRSGDNAGIGADDRVDSRTANGDVAG